MIEAPDAAPDSAPDSAPQHLRPPTMARRAARSVVEWLMIIGAALLVALIVKTFLIQAFYIPSASMEPQLNIRDRILVNKLSYRLHEVNRSDIVVFRRPKCDQSDPVIKDLVKRVIGLPGDTVEGKNSTVLVNGRALEEDYLPPGQTTADFGPVKVPAGHLWLMGDNRENSKDSRFLCDGSPTFIEQDAVIGRAFVRVFPISRVSLL